MKNHRPMIWQIGVLLFGLMLLGSCAASKTYLLNVTYDPSGTPVYVSRFAKPVTVALYTFQDTRSDKSIIGRRVYRDGMVDFFKPDVGTTEELVTRNVAKTLEAAGFTVKRVHRYLNMDTEDFKDIPGDAALGGTISEIWVEAKTGVATTDTYSQIRIQVIWGFPQDRTWVKKTISGSAQETNRPFYGPKHAEAQINAVFKDSLDKLLKDEPQLKERISKISQ